VRSPDSGEALPLNRRADRRSGRSELFPHTRRLLGARWHSLWSYGPPVPQSPILANDGYGSRHPWEPFQCHRLFRPLHLWAFCPDQVGPAPARFRTGHSGPALIHVVRFRRGWASSYAPPVSVFAIQPPGRVDPGPHGISRGGRGGLDRAVRRSCHELGPTGRLPLSTSKRNRSWEAKELLDLLVDLEAGTLAFGVAGSEADVSHVHSDGVIDRIPRGGRGTGPQRPSYGHGSGIAITPVRRGGTVP